MLILGLSCATLAESWAIVGISWRILGPSWAILGLSSWGSLGECLGDLGASLADPEECLGCDGVTFESHPGAILVVMHMITHVVGLKRNVRL